MTRGPIAGGTGSNDWESQAQHWLRWARTPGHDAYWHYRGSFFDHLLPAPGHATLEVGCGEGRVARDLTGRGHRVIGVDLAPTLVSAAKRADPEGNYLLADAASLPFAPETFDQVVAYNSLMDIDDMPGAVREAGRVLRPGGTLSVSVTHPVNDAGHFVDSTTYVIDRPYLERQRFDETFERDGLIMTFFGWTHSPDAIEGGGLVITRIREPPGTHGDAANPSLPVPVFLQLRAVKPAGDWN